MVVFVNMLLSSDKNNMNSNLCWHNMYVCFLHAWYCIDWRKRFTFGLLQRLISKNNVSYNDTSISSFLGLMGKTWSAKILIFRFWMQTITLSYKVYAAGSCRQTCIHRTLHQSEVEWAWKLQFTSSNLACAFAWAS